MEASNVMIEQFMSKTPHGIEPHETLAVARRRMQDLKVKHLPVRVGGRVVGVLSERDLYVLAAFPEVDFKLAKAGFAMTPDPYTVAPTESVCDVAAEMAARRIGSALVVDENERLLGIFTDTDALNALAAVLHGGSRSAGQ